jgi:hypothetical protein
MRNILALVGAATVTFLAVGWYLGWYQISSLRSPRGEQSFNVNINPDKITDDVKKGVEKGGEFVDSLRDKSKGDAKPATPGPASNFFTPTPTPAEKDKAPSTGGWKPIGGKPPTDDEGDLGFRVPRN